MIAVDTSTIIAYLQADEGPDTEQFDAALAGNNAAIAPVVIAEMLSDPRLPSRHRALVLGLYELPILPDYWARVGAARAALIAHRLKARLADAMISQACIDNDVALLTRDRDFRHFQKHRGLRLA